jgi:hypothetical protein
MTKSDGNGIAELAEDNFTFDVPDDALERAASVADGKNTTWAYCTQAWYNSGWPLQSRTESNKSTAPDAASAGRLGKRGFAISFDEASCIATNF